MLLPEDRLVVDATGLKQLCKELRRHPWIAVDTEFIRERTFFPQLCLVQVAAPGLVACVDPITLADLAPLLDVLYQPQTIKVLHGAVQDLEIFFGLRQALPIPVFDTQIAATVLGQGEEVGYGALVKALLGVDLEKGHTRTDWSRRPLQPAQLRYAADDVRYLREIYQRQLAELEQRGRSGWLVEDFAALCDSERYRVNPPAAWKRVKGIKGLRASDLPYLQALAAWREREAVARNLPRRWVLGDDDLLELVRRKPRDWSALGRVRGLNEAKLRRHGEVWLEAMAAAAAMPPAQWPQLTRSRRLPPQQEAVADAAAALLRARANRHQVSPGSVGSRAEIERLVAGERDLALLHGWRAEIAGRALLALVEGRGSLRIVAGRLELLEEEVAVVASR